MKPDSTKTLRAALEYLNIVKDCGSLNEGEIKFSVGEAIRAIESVFYMETPNTSRKFDLYKIASTNELRPAMCGIFHDRGYAWGCSKSELNDRIFRLERMLKSLKYEEEGAL